MHKQPPRIDAQKLRRLLLEKQSHVEAAHRLTDRFIDLKQEAGRLEDKICRDRRGGWEIKSEQCTLDGLRADIEQVREDREQASARLDNFAIVDELVAYARRCGYFVDEQRCIVRLPVTGEAQRVERPRQDTGQPITTPNVSPRA